MNPIRIYNLKTSKIINILKDVVCPRSSAVLLMLKKIKTKIPLIGMMKNSKKKCIFVKSMKIS